MRRKYWSILRVVRIANSLTLGYPHYCQGQGFCLGRGYANANGYAMPRARLLLRQRLRQRQQCKRGVLLQVNWLRAQYPTILMTIGINLLIPLATVAQTSPPLERLPQTNPSILAPQPLPLKPSVDTSPIPQAPVNSEQINVLRYEIVGSTVFSDRELAAITQPFTGIVTFDGLQSAKNAIDKLYIDNHYLTTGAYIPTGQTLSIDGAVVKIQIVEGKLEQIKIVGTERLDPNYIRSRLALATQQPLNNERLIEGLRLLQQDPLIDNITAELSGGIQPGTNLLEIQVHERNTLTSEIGLNNNRAASIGTIQRRAQISQTNLTGAGDNLILAYNNTDGSNGIDTSYTIPLNAFQTTLSFNAGGTNSQIIEEPYKTLDINTKSRYYEINIRHPIIRRAYQDATQEFAISLTGAKIESNSAFGDIPFALSRGADDNGRTSVSALRLAQEYIQRDNRSVLTLRNQFNLGLNAFNSTINNNAPDSRFFTWQIQGRYLKQLGNNTDLIVQGRVQLADRSLLSLEQFSSGGQNTVRGYRQDALIADNGAFASVEWQLPLSTSAKNLIQLAPFIDIGTVWNHNSNANSLLSTGVGLQWRTDRLNARIDWGIPLINYPSQKNSWQDNGLYFSIRYFLF
jgi:hemolysin activation/secretion protein